MKAVIKTYIQDEYINVECDKADVDRDSEYIFVYKDGLVISMIPFTEVKMFYIIK